MISKNPLEMQHSAFTNCDVVIVRKQSAFERHQSQSAKHIESHLALMRVLTELRDLLTSMKVSHEVLTIEELTQGRFSFFEAEPKSPDKYIPLPARKLVIALGGDGTLLHASHFAGGPLRLLGINAFPRSSVGHLCRARDSDFKEIVAAALNHTLPYKKVSRIAVELLGVHTKAPNDASQGDLESEEPKRPLLPLALNDVLFCNAHPAASSRYTLAICELRDKIAEAHKNSNLRDNSASTDEQNAARTPVVLASEEHVSSGVWISTAAGSSAAISSYGLQRLPLESSRFLIAVREPYFRPENYCTLTRASLDGNSQFICLKSQMSAALVSVDGADFCASVSKGQEIRLKMDQKNEVLLHVL